MSIPNPKRRALPQERTIPKSLRDARSHLMKSSVKANVAGAVIAPIRMMEVDAFPDATANSAIVAIQNNRTLNTQMTRPAFMPPRRLNARPSR